MQLCETKLLYNGQTRFYVDGRPVSRAAFDQIKANSRLDTFQTVTSPLFMRQLCCARPISSDGSPAL